MTRKDIAKGAGIGESRLRWLEDQGLVPRFGSVDEGVYRARVELIVAADDAGMSGQQIRKALNNGTKGDEMSERSLFIPIRKIDEERRLLYGRITEEKADKSGEVFDYVTSKPFYQKWSSDISDATGGKSKGNVRVMHTPKIAGKLTDLVFNDDEKAIDCVAKVLDDETWQLCLEGGFTGLSHGGRCVKAWQGDDGQYRYTLNPLEVSLVDNPALSSARFTLLKADGATERRPFKAVETTDFDRAFERAKADFLAKEAALDGGYVRRDRGDDVDPSIAPREGETWRDSQVRRFGVYKSECALAGREPLGIQAWLHHDGVVHPEVITKIDAERNAPRIAAEAARDALLAEVAAKTDKLMRAEEGFRGNLAKTHIEVFKRDEDLAKRYRAAFTRGA